MVKERKEYIEEAKWNLHDLYACDEDWQQDYLALKDTLCTYQDFQGHILENAATLYDFLTFDTELEKKLERIFIYAHLKTDQDSTNGTYQTMYGKAVKLYEQYNEATAFIVPEFMQVNYEVIEKYLAENPKLKEFARLLREMYKFKKYTLSEPEEKLLSSMTRAYATPEDVYSSLCDADLKFGLIKDEDGKPVELTEALYRKFLGSPIRRVRKAAFNRILKTYGSYKNTVASLFSANVQNQNKLARIRGYASALDASLYANDIPQEVYFNLIRRVKANVRPLSRFWQLKKKVLGVSSLHLYDTYSPVVNAPKKEYTKEEAKELILTSLRVLGPTYVGDLKKAFAEKWIDFCPNKGKRGGAYCTCCYSTHPYVLLSYTKTLDDVSTLAHELGHAMHYYYAVQNQTYQDYEYSIFVAEVASQVNQILLSEYLIDHSSNKLEKQNLLDDLIQGFKSTVYRQTMFADFEYQVHELEAKGEVLTHEVLENLYYQLNKEYFGEHIVVDDAIRYEWERIPHFYMNFYVYQYATAYIAAIKIAMDILHDKPKAVQNYLEFLKLGCTKSPIDSLKVAGVDMLEETPYIDAFAYFEELIQELEKVSND